MDVTVKVLFRLLGTFLSGELHELPCMVMTLLPAGEWLIGNKEKTPNS